MFCFVFFSPFSDLPAEPVPVVRHGQRKLHRAGQVDRASQREIDVSSFSIIKKIKYFEYIIFLTDKLKKNETKAFKIALINKFASRKQQSN